MSVVATIYNSKGLYGSVKPITGIPQIKVFREEGWEADAPNDYHCTICYDQSAMIPRESIDVMATRARVDDVTVFRAFPAGGLQAWSNDGKLYVGIEMYSPELFALREHIQKTLDVKSSFDIYKCHITLGKFRGFPEAMLQDLQACRQFVASNVSLEAPLPGLIELSYLRFEDAKK